MVTTKLLANLKTTQQQQRLSGGRLLAAAPVIKWPPNDTPCNLLSHFYTSAFGHSTQRWMSVIILAATLMESVSLLY